MTTRPILERLRESRNRHWTGVAGVVGLSVAFLVASSVFLPCGDPAAPGCGPGEKAASALLIILGFGGLLLGAPVATVLAVWTHLSSQRALERDVESLDP